MIRERKVGRKAAKNAANVSRLVLSIQLKVSHDKLYKLLVIHLGEEVNRDPFEYDCVERPTFSKPKTNKQNFANHDKRVKSLLNCPAFFKASHLLAFGFFCVPLYFLLSSYFHPLFYKR